MTKLLILIDRLANRSGIAVLVALYVMVFGSIAVTLSQLTALTRGKGILDFDRGYSTARVREVFDSYGEQGFVLYGRIQMLDLFNPAIYSLLFGCIIYLFWKGSKHMWVVLLPLLAGLLDYAENLTLYLLSISYPDLSEQLVTISSTLSITKNIALFGAIAALLIGSLLWLVHRFQKSQK